MIIRMRWMLGGDWRLSINNSRQARWSLRRYTSKFYNILFLQDVDGNFRSLSRM